MDDVTPDHWPHTPICAAHDSQGEMWTSRRPNDQQLAAALCTDCPVRARCHAYAEQLRTIPISRHDPNPRPWGVWAGVLYDGTGRAPIALPWPTTPIRGRRDAARRLEQAVVRRQRDRLRRQAS